MEYDARYDMLEDLGQDPTVDLSYDWEFDPDAPPACPCCRGAGVELGRLGHLDHFRCRSCGIVFSLEVAA